MFGKYNGRDISIETASAFGMTSLMYIADHYDGRTSAVLKPEIFNFLVRMT